MASERVQRQINLLLDQIEEEASQLNWAAVRERAQAVLAYDPENRDPLAFLAAAERAQGSPAAPAIRPTVTTTTATSHPTSFANGRYQVKELRGEGGEKKGFLAHTVVRRRKKMRLEGKVALISGGARGMGASEAKLFVGEGAKVIIGDILEDDGRRTEAEINESGGECIFVRLDVTNESQWENAVSEAVGTVWQIGHFGEQRRNKRTGTMSRTLPSNCGTG